MTTQETFGYGTDFHNEHSAATRTRVLAEMNAWKERLWSPTLGDAVQVASIEGDNRDKSRQDFPFGE